MKSSHPPSLATWLLEHLLPRGTSEPLAGDLLEDYSQGRSAAWYWRQVLAAVMVSLSKELRSRWVTVIFGVVVSGAVPWKLIYHNSEFQSLLLWGIRLPWPMSLFYFIAYLSAFETVLLLVAVSAYLGVTRSFNLRSFLSGLLVALPVVALGNIGVAFLLVLHIPSFIFYYVVWRLPLFFGLVLALWVACPGAVRAEATRLPA